MASRRNLVSRARLNEDSNSSPAQRRQREDRHANEEPTPLPEYEPPTCPLTASGRRALEELRINHNSARYQKHIAESKKLLPMVIGDITERIGVRKEKVAKAAERRRRQGKGDDEKTEAEVEDEQFASQYAMKVDELTIKAEQSMRDLIDYSDELAMRDTLLKDVIEAINAVPLPAPRPQRISRRQSRNDDSDEEEEEEDEPPAEVEILSAAELSKKAREDYTTAYNSQTMLERYENNDYKGFKTAVHEALHPGADAPPLPRASKWFPQDRANKPSNSSGRQQGRSIDDGADDDDGSDEEIYISGVRMDFKCPLSLRKFEKPYTNRNCKHTYEKSQIIDYINGQGTFFAPSQTRGQRQGEKQCKCVQIGCDNMLILSDFYDDTDIIRRMKRAQRQAAYDDMEEEDEEEPRGTQRSRPEELDDESEDEIQSRKIAKVKRERASNMAHSGGLASSDVEEMEE